MVTLRLRRVFAVLVLEVLREDQGKKQASPVIFKLLGHWKGRRFDCVLDECCNGQRLKSEPSY